jgi:mono/diheme cytochrome c family protein
MTEWRTMSANGILPLYQKVFFLFSASLAGLLLNAQTVNFHNAPDSTKSMKNPLEGQPPANGQHAYHLRCARCHGEQGDGSGNIPPLKEDKIKATTPGELFWFITQGDENNGMPSWAQLSRQERWLIVNYVKAIGTPMAARAAAETSEPLPPQSSMRHRRKLLSLTYATKNRGQFGRSRSKTFLRRDQLLRQRTAPRSALAMK